MNMGTFADRMAGFKPEVLKTILEAPAMIAFGIDPQNHKVHIAVRTAEGTKTYHKTLSTELQIAIDMFRRML
jgi:hypothetical protein